MIKRALLPLILILSLLTAGCQALPEIISAVESITSPTEALPTGTLTAESDETPVPTASLAEPTATELPPTETPTATPTETPEPVLSEQITLTEPSVSTTGRRQMIALRPARRVTPMASVTVRIAGSPSGMAATASPTTAR